MSEQRAPVPNTGGVASEVASVVKTLDPNMVAVLLLTLILNGMFFWTYVELAGSRHTEFMAALNSCPDTTLQRAVR
jgi:hypothetical protein